MSGLDIEPAHALIFLASLEAVAAKLRAYVDGTQTGTSAPVLQLNSRRA